MLVFLFVNSLASCTSSSRQTRTYERTFQDTLLTDPDSAMMTTKFWSGKFSRGKVAAYEETKTLNLRSVQRTKKRSQIRVDLISKMYGYKQLKNRKADLFTVQ